MSLTVQCPKCSLELEAPAELAGKPATCPGCTSQFIVTAENSRVTDASGSGTSAASTTSRRSSTSTNSDPPSGKAPGTDSRAIPAPARRGSRKTSSTFIPASSESPASPAIPPSSKTPPLDSSVDSTHAAATDSGGNTRSKVSGSNGSTPPPGTNSESISNSTTESPRATGAILGGDTASGGTGARTAKFKGLPVAEDAPSGFGEANGPPPTPASMGQPDPDSQSLKSETGVHEAGDSTSPADAPKPKRSKRKKDRSKSRVKRSVDSRDRKTAKIVEGGSIETRIQMGADGTLPQLVVKELETKAPSEQQASGSNPIVLIAVLGFSVLMSIAMLFVPTEGSSSTELNLGDSLVHIQANYFGQEPFRDYEILLREAVQHENRGDRRAAKAIYRRILDMMHAEGLDEKQGLSGPRYAYSPPNDADLEKHLEFLIRTRN